MRRKNDLIAYIVILGIVVLILGLIVCGLWFAAGSYVLDMAFK